MKKVSAIITTFNRESDIVERAILSIENQSYDVFEIIVVDDNKINNPFSNIIKQMCLRHAKVKYIRQNGNQGACKARNLGINNSTGDFVSFLDDDDEWLPSKIEKQMKVFDTEDSSGKLGMVFCSGIIRIEDDKTELNYHNYDSFLPNPTFDDMLLNDRIGSTSIPLIKKNVFQDVGLFWEKQPARQDYEMWLRITKKYLALGIKEKLFIHWMHKGDQISKNKKKSYFGFKNIYKRYRKDFKKNKDAHISIILKILANSFRPSLYNLYLRFLKYYLNFVKYK